MAYSGYLIKIKGISGSQSASYDYTIPMSYMIFQSYKGTYSVLDNDAKRNAKGKLVRKALAHKVAHSTVDIRPLNNTELGNLMSNIQARYVKKKEKKVKASMWVPELNDYVEAYFYVPDTEFTIKKTDYSSVEYDSFTLELIGY